MERIAKNSSEFRGKNRCRILRQNDGLKLETFKSSYYDNAIIVKEILIGYFKGEYQISDFEDLVSQGVEDDYLTQKSGDLRKEQLVKCLKRACLSEHRKPRFVPKTVLQLGIYDISVKPDAVFEDDKCIELVLYRPGKPSVNMKGKKRDVSVNQCLELYFLLLYGRQMLKTDEKKTVRASYYFMRKDTDNKAWDNDFFSGVGGNIVYLEEEYTGGSNIQTDYDKSFMEQLAEYQEGSECTDEDCKGCILKTSCQYQKTPKPFERKTLNSKNGVITPSEAQQKIIDFRKGFCRVNATAGSGKTECMTERGARMFAEGIKPSEILFITFTDAGALEMKERIFKKCIARGLNISMDAIRAMTFNTFAYNIVRDRYKDCGFTKPPIVIDDVRNSVIITQMLDEHNISGLDYMNFQMDMPNCKGALSCAAKVFSIIKSENINPDDDDADERIREELQECGDYRFFSDGAITQLKDLYKEYDQRLKEDNLLQFADQEPLMNKVLDIYPDYLERYGYRHIVVDEFQDSNDMQLATIRRLTECSTFESLMVVGDDSQSIYGFRKTSPENILHFFEKLNIDNGIDLYLTENRRSTPEILTLANRINDLNEEKVDKEMTATRPSGRKPYIGGFHSKQEEYSFIAEEIKKMLESGYEPEDIAFIAAKKTELVAMGAELSQLGIPWIMKNPMPLQENSRVQAAMSLADAFYQPEAETLYFNYLVAKYDGELLGNKSTEEIMAEIAELKKTFMNMDLLEIGFQRQLFHDMLNEIKGKDEVYQYFLELVYANEDFQSELEYIQNFRKFGEKAAKKMEQSYAGVVLTTAHSSKGLEWPVVFNSITNYDAKTLHSGRNKQKQIEEKRRLLFVSVTRARDILYVTGQYVAFGAKDDRTYNQFLREVYEVSGMEFNPIDPLEEEKKAEAKKKTTKKKSTPAA